MCINVCMYVCMYTHTYIYRGEYISTFLFFGMFWGNRNLYWCHVNLSHSNRKCGSIKWSLVNTSNWQLRGPSRNLLLFGLLGEEDCLNVGQDSSLGNGDTRKELVELFVVADGKLQVTGDDPGLLVVTGSITCQFQNFSSQVLHDCSQVDWGSSTYTFSIVALAQETMDTTDRELKSSSAASGL